MSRRQVLVQLDDELVERLDELALARGTNRSALLRESAYGMLAALDTAAADRQLVEAYTRLPQEPELVESLTRMAARSIPEW